MERFCKTGVPLLFVAFGLFPTFAAGSTFSVTTQGPGFFGSNGYSPVTITDDDYLSSGLTVYAGAFALAGDMDGNGSVDEFDAFCLDISAHMQGTSDYQVTGTPFDNSLLSPTQLADIESLYETGYSTLDLTDPSETAAFQLALWEIANEDSGAYAMTTGSFTASGSAAVAEADALLAGLGGPSTQQYDLFYLQSTPRDTPRSQNLVTAAPIPLPAAGLMLLGAIAALRGVRRRRRSA